MSEPEPATERDIDAIRRLLTQSNYSAAGLAAAGIDVGMGVRTPDIPILSHALEPVEPLATLARLFLFGEALDAAVLRRRLGQDPSHLLRAGLARMEGSRILPIVRLTPWRGLVLAHDPDPEGDLWVEHVSGPTPAAQALVALVSTDGGAALDMGTGCGVLAVALADGVEHVVATDINPAALRLTALNAALNGTANVETRSGSLFEPVAGESFDLIVSNPPFVIAPDSALLFRHSPFGRDEISRTVVRSAAAHLRDGGCAYALVNWVEAGSGTWLDTLRGWLEGTGCDAVCLLQGVEDPLAYAVRWNVREQQLRPDRYPATLDRWLAHFRAQSIGAIGTGAIVLRRRTGPNWIHGLALTAPTEDDASRQIQAIVQGQDFLAGIADDDAMAAYAFELAGPHRLNQTLVYRDGEYVVEPATLVLDGGLGATVRIEPDLIPVVLRLDGSQVIRAIVDEVAPATGQEVATLTARATALVRELLGVGFVRPRSAVV